MEDKISQELQTEQEITPEPLQEAEAVKLEEKEEASVEEAPAEETLTEEAFEPLPVDVVDEEISLEDVIPQEELEESEEKLEEPEEESLVEITAEETVEEEIIEEEIIEEETVAEEAGDEDAVEEPTAQEMPQEESVQVAPRGLVVQTWQLIVALVVVAAMVVGGVLLGVFLGNRKDDDGFNGSPVDYDWELQHGAATNPNQITLPGYADLLFPADKKQIDMILPNHKSNPCYLRYTLMLEETGEILYQSPLIAPGKAVLEIELSRILPIGDYHLVIAIDSVSLADGRTPMNGAEHRVLLQVR